MEKKSGIRGNSWGNDGNFIPRMVETVSPAFIIGEVDLSWLLQFQSYEVAAIFMSDA